MALVLSVALALKVAALVLLAWSATASAQATSPTAPVPSAATAAGNLQDPLGTLTITPGEAARRLPRIGVVPSFSADFSDVLLHTIVKRDLELSGEVELLSDRAAPPGVDASDTTVDLDEWAAKGVEAVVKVAASTAGDRASLDGHVYLVKGKRTGPVLQRKVTVDAAEVRKEAHRLADLVIGALTGQNGGFASRMTFVSGIRAVRRAYVIDSDGHDPHPISPPDEVAIASAFGTNEEPHWISGKGFQQYRIATRNGPVLLPVPGSVYGLAFSKDRSRVAVSIAGRDGIHVYAGPDFATLQRASPIATALQPAFTPSGKLAFAGAGRFGQRIYVGGQPISPEGVSASSPTFCNHPDGVIAVFAAGSGKSTDLVRTGESGGGLVRLTQNQGENSSPACSPDGRLVAFFSTRTSNEGPGLYVMRVDGQRPRRISTLLGDSLRWDPLPASQPAQPAPAAPVATPAPRGGAD